MKRRNGYGFDVLDNILETVGLKNMIKDSDDDSDDDSDWEITVNWIQRAISESELRYEGREISDVPAKKRAKRTWKCRNKLPFTSSMFFRDYHNPCVQDLTHRDAKEFRMNYRMPWTEVHKIVRLFIERKWVVTQEECDKKRVPGQRVCPPEIKILGVMYWMGEGCSFRTIYNLSGRVLSPMSFLSFAKRYTLVIAKYLAPKYIKIPKNVAELNELSVQYESLGFPGCVGSTDGVQIAWEGCPNAYRVSFTGKEKYPTLGFNVTVDHELRVLHVCSMFADRFNDKTKILYDDYVKKLRTDYYAGFDYNLTDERGVVTTHDVPYLLCDGGYHRWVQTMCAFKTTNVEALALWSKKLESTRKDAERVFGVMKKRFKVNHMGMG